MDKRKRTPLFGSGLVAGALGGLIVGRWLSTPRRMPHLDVWQRAMAEERGEVEAAMLAARVQARYDDLYAGRPRFTHRALRSHLERNILPGLALYQVLGEESSDQEAVLAEVETLFGVAFVQLGKLMPLLGRRPDPFAVFRQAAHWVVRFGFPPQGWEMELVEDSDQCYAFDVHRCFYLDVLAAYSAPELTALYCKMDDLVYESLPSSITWERTKTLGRGDDCCNFRWCRVVPERTAARLPEMLGGGDKQEDWQ